MNTSSINNDFVSFSDIFKALPMPTYVWKKSHNDFELIQLNEAAVRSLKTENKDIIGVKAHIFYKENPEIINKIKDCFEHQKSFKSENMEFFSHALPNSFLDITYTFVNNDIILLQTESAQNQTFIELDSQNRDQLLASFIEDNPAIIAMFDNEMRFLAVSKKWITRYKLEGINLIGKNHYDIFPEIGDDWKQVHQRCLNGATEKRDEDKFVRLNGEVEWDKWEVCPWYKTSKEIGGIIVFTELITERKNAEEKIKKDADKLQKILENLPFGVSIENEKDETTFFNKMMIEIMGYTIQDVPNIKKWFDTVFPDENYREKVRKEWNEKVEKSLKTNSQCEPIQVKVCCKDGTYKIVESYYAPIGDEYITIYKDITDLKNKEFQLEETNEVIIQQNNELIRAKTLVEESEFRLLQAQKVAKVGNWQTDLETLNVFWSAETYHIFELDEKTFSPTHQSFLTFVHPEDRDKVNDAFFHSFSSKKYNTIEHRIITFNGNVKYVEERWIVSFDKNDNAISIFGTCQDITKRKMIELELIRTNLKIEENEQRLKLAVDAAKLGVWEWNFIDDELIWDDRMYEINGVKKGIETNNFNKWSDHLHPEDKEKAIKEGVLALEGIQRYDTSFRIIKDNGEIAYIKADAQIIKDANGKPTRIIGVNRDITKKKLSEIILDDKELKYRSLFENSSDAILLFSDGIWIDCNNSALKLFDTTKERIIGSNPCNYSPKYQSNGTLSEDEIKKRIQLVFEGKTQNFEWEHCKEDGAVFFTDIKLNLLKIEGKPYIQAIIRDITDKRIVENKLNEFLYFFENSNDLLAVSNTEGYFEIANHQMLKTLGYTIDELTTKEYDEIIFEDDVEKARAKAVILREGQPLENFSIRILKKDGNPIWLEWNVFINEISGKYYSIGRDISERKKYEEQLALSALIVNSTQDAIMSVSLENNITSWNQGARKMLGYKADEIIGKSIFTLIPEELFGDEQMITNKIKNIELVDYFETKRIKKNGEIIDVSITVSPIIDESGKVIAASKIMRNISARKLIELEKKKIVSDLIQRNRDLEQFTNIVSHNLRAPVANIIGINNFMLKGNLSEHKKQELNVALNKSVIALDTVIRDLNLILQIRRDVSEQKTTVKFANLVEKISLSISNQIKTEKVKFLLNFSEVSEMLTIKSYMYSIFYNLISNSIKYRQAKENPIIKIKSTRNGNNIVLIFKDNGLGFDSIKNQEQIFGLYKRFHIHVEGKGLGLFMVKSQVETLGGKISVKSKLNEGTEFKIEFEQ